MKKHVLLSLASILILSLLLTACNLPQETDEAAGVNTAVALTVAAKTVEAQEGTQTQAPEVTDTQEDVPTATETPSPTNTEVPTETLEPTATPLPCNRAEFVTDVTVPDGKDFLKGESFTKTWRLENTGSCTWTADYDIVFSGGDRMGAPDAVQLTSGTVEPGDTVDVSVDLTAPDSPGTFRGNWKLRDDEGVIFGVENSSEGYFWVEIQIDEPTDTPSPTEHTVTLDHASRGHIVDGGSLLTNANNAGDTGDNKGRQGFITYDVSSIPDDATILSVKLVPVSHDTVGSPFSDLGYLRVYVDNYGSLDMGDYTPPPVTGATNRFASLAQLENSSYQKMNSIGINGVQDALSSDTFQIRLQFNNTETNNDGNADVYRARMQLVVTYKSP